MCPVHPSSTGLWCHLWNMWFFHTLWYTLCVYHLLFSLHTPMRLVLLRQATILPPACSFPQDKRITLYFKGGSQGRVISFCTKWSLNIEDAAAKHGRCTGLWRESRKWLSVTWSRKRDPVSALLTLLGLQWSACFLSSSELCPLFLSPLDFFTFHPVTLQ